MWPDRVSNPGPLTYESGALLNATWPGIGYQEPRSVYWTKKVLLCTHLVQPPPDFIQRQVSISRTLISKIPSFIGLYNLDTFLSYYLYINSFYMKLMMSQSKFLAPENYFEISIVWNDLDFEIAIVEDIVYCVR